MCLGILARMPTTRPSVRRTALGTAALLLFVLALAACDLSASPSASSVPAASSDACGPDEAAEGGINGIVVDADGNPLNDIFIFIQTADGFRGTTRTGEDGVFTAPGVSGEFQITTTDIDYAELVQNVTVPCGELVDVELVLTPVEG
jgi:hypothetical protein